MIAVPVLKKIALTFALLCLFLPCLHAQQVLNTRLSLSVKDVPLADVLDTISRKGYFFFSFQTGILPLQQKVSVNARQQTVAELLQLLLGDHYEATEEGHYVILREAAYVTITGSVTDAEGSVPVDAATVAVPAQDKMTFTSADGTFALRLQSSNDVVLVVRKMGYAPLRLPIQKGTAKLDLQLQPEAVELPPVEVGSRQDNDNAKNALARTMQLSTPGIKVGGLLNISDDTANTLQLAFAVNVAGKSCTGLQLTSIHNVVKDTLSGMQVSGLINKVEGDMNGVQLSAFNYARRSKGLQIGAVNIADSSDGWSLGLLNVVKGESGYRRVSFFSSGIMNTNISLKTGNANLYNIWMFGRNLWPGQDMMAIGIGLGHDFRLSPKIKMASQVAYHVVWCGQGFENRLAQIKLLPEYRLTRRISLYGGMTANWYKNRDYRALPGYKNITGITGDGYAQNTGKTKTWVGWELGITYDPRYNYNSTTSRQGNSWILSGGLGLGLSAVSGFSDDVKSIALRAEKYIFEDIAFTATSGYSYVSRYNLRIVPLAAGLKVFQGEYLYVAAEAGAALMDWRRASVLLAPAIGLNYRDKLDLSLRSDFYGFHEIHMGLRLAYGLPL